MNKPDLETVSTRRAQIASELAGLDKIRAEIEAEDQDLIVAERALKRLAARVAEAPVMAPVAAVAET